MSDLLSLSFEAVGRIFHSVKMGTRAGPHGALTAQSQVRASIVTARVLVESKRRDGTTGFP